MTPLITTLTIDLNDREQLKNLIDNLNVLLYERSGKDYPDEDYIDKEDDYKIKVPSLNAPVDKSKKQPVTKKPIDEKVVGETQVEKEEKAAQMPCSLDHIRSIVSKKMMVSENKSKLKAKLKELGSENVTLLQEDKYVEFLTFVNSL